MGSVEEMRRKKGQEYMAKTTMEVGKRDSYLCGAVRATKSGAGRHARLGRAPFPEGATALSRLQ
jgi:hypothetical protein